jgi:hypothetical protein
MAKRKYPKVNKKRFRNKYLTKDAFREIIMEQNIAYSRAKRRGKEIVGFNHSKHEGWDGSYKCTGLGMYAIPIPIFKKDTSTAIIKR